MLSDILKKLKDRRKQFESNNDIVFGIDIAIDIVRRTKINKKTKLQKLLRQAIDHLDKKQIQLQLDFILDDE